MPKTRRKKRRAINFLPKKKQQTKIWFFTNSLLGLNFIPFKQTPKQRASQNRNIAAKTAIFGAPSKGKTTKIKDAAHQSSKKTIGKASKYLAVL
jgi:hypothetical protein